MNEHAKIQAACDRLKKQWYAEFPVCIFCLQKVNPGAGQLCHKIRRSERSKKFSNIELQTLKLNTGLGHPNCHDTYDNKPELAKFLPGYGQIMKDIKKIDPEIYNKRINLC